MGRWGDGATGITVYLLDGGVLETAQIPPYCIITSLLRRTPHARATALRPHLPTNSRALSKAEENNEGLVLSPGSFLRHPLPFTSFETY